jgi:formate-dependent nitrite reductase cytochrome c552 subunit
MIVAILGGYGPCVMQGVFAEEARSDPSTRKKPPPLVIDRSAPLLLNEATEKEKQAAALSDRVFAVNETCLACHMNFIREALVVHHASGEVSCIDCHGESIAHRNDENSTIPPDRMYPSEAIDPSCLKCHETHNAPAAKVVARWMACCADEKDAATLTCTDCHGKHRAERRRVVWDKRTGKLIRAD